MDIINATTCLHLGPNSQRRINFNPGLKRVIWRHNFSPWTKFNLGLNFGIHKGGLNLTRAKTRYDVTILVNPEGHNFSQPRGVV